MIDELSLIIMLIGVVLFIVITYIHNDFENSLDKVMDESCYYCIYSTEQHTIRNRNKNTCKRINNCNWTSNQIRNCRYRVKE